MPQFTRSEMRQTNTVKARDVVSLCFVLPWLYTTGYIQKYPRFCIRTSRIYFCWFRVYHYWFTYSRKQ